MTKRARSIRKYILNLVFISLSIIYRHSFIFESVQFLKSHTEIRWNFIGVEKAIGKKSKISLMYISILSIYQTSSVYKTGISLLSIY